MSEKINKDLTNDNDIQLFTGEEIKEVYELGRIHEKKGSDCTGEIIRDTWVRAHILNKNIKWV